MTTGHPWIDTSSAPLYAMRYPADPKSLIAGAPSFLEAFIQFWRGMNERMALVTDLSALGSVPPSLRKAIAEASNDMRFKQRELLVAWAVVIAQPVQRLVFQGYLWMAPPPTPYRVFAVTKEAEDWATTALVTAGVIGRPDPRRDLHAARDLAESVSQRMRK